VTIEIYAFRWVPPFAQGFVRDLRLRWALEEAGLPYEERLIGLEDRASFRGVQPFGQIPAYRDDEVEMFESGAIVLHIMEKSDTLAPRDARGRARVTSWVVAALNSVEPFMLEFLACEGGCEARRPQTLERLEQRLADVSAWLGERDYLEGRFTAGDLMMTCVLRELVQSRVLERFPKLDALRARCEARPAFGRALEAQLAVFRAHESAPA